MNKYQTKMKVNFLMFMMIIGMMLSLPTSSYAQITDDDLEYQGGNTGNEDDWGPVSLDPTIITGVLSHVNKTLTNTFLVDLGAVTIWIVDKEGNLYSSVEVNTTTQKSVTIDLKSLPAQEYKVICFTREGQQWTTFKL